GHGLSVGTGYQNVNLTTNLLGGSHDVEGGGLHLCIVVFSYDKYWHDQITFASFFSFSTRVATSGTMTPAERAGGSVTFKVLRRGATSTPSSPGVTVSSGFFLAFMMFGSVTERGSLRRRSVVMMAGNLRVSV